MEWIIFTGDTLFVRGNGRTDFQQGSNEKLFDSVMNKIYSFPSETLIYPGHDYKGMSVSTIDEEKVFNPKLKVGTSLEEFLEMMNNLKLANPKRIQEAVPANMQCGNK